MIITVVLMMTQLTFNICFQKWRWNESTELRLGNLNIFPSVSLENLLIQMMNLMTDISFHYSFFLHYISDCICKRDFIFAKISFSIFIILWKWKSQRLKTLLLKPSVDFFNWKISCCFYIFLCQYAVPTTILRHQGGYTLIFTLTTGTFPYLQSLKILGFLWLPD